MAINRINKSLVQRLGGDSIFGNGADGAVTIANGVTTHLARDMYYSSLTVNSGGTLFTNGFRVFVNGTLTNNGTIGFPGAVASNVADGSGTIAGRQTTLNPTSAWGVSTSTVASTDLNDIDDAVSGWFITGNGTRTKIGSGSLGVAGTSGTTVAAGSGNSGTAGPLGIFPGATAGQPGGIGNSGNSGNAATAGTGGAGGLGGGLVIIVAKTIAGSGTILSRGFAGSSGNPATPGSAGNSGTTAPTRPASHNAGGHPAGNHPHPAGTAPPVGHANGTHNSTHHNTGYFHHSGDSFFVIAPHNAHTYSNAAHGAHNPNSHNFSNHNATSNASHHGSGTTHGSHGANGHRGFTNHNGTANPSKNHNAGHGYHHHPSGHHAGNHNSGHGHHAGNTQHTSGYHTQPSGTTPASAGPWTSGPFAPHYNANSNATLNVSTINAGTHPFAAVNHPAGGVGSNAYANPSGTPHPNWPGGPGGTGGNAGTANAGNTGITGSDGGVVVIARNVGTANTQMSHSNYPYTKAVDI